MLATRGHSAGGTTRTRTTRTGVRRLPTTIPCLGQGGEGEGDLHPVITEAKLGLRRAPIIVVIVSNIDITADIVLVKIFEVGEPAAPGVRVGMLVKRIVGAPGSPPTDKARRRVGKQRRGWRSRARPGHQATPNQYPQRWDGGLAANAQGEHLTQHDKTNPLPKRRTCRLEAVDGVCKAREYVRVCA